MRFEAPSPTQSRWVARDVEYHGVTIPAGSKISLLNGSADRDERHFPNPDRSTCGVTSTASSRSDTARTSASVRRWRAWRHASRWRRRSSATPRTRSTSRGLEFVHTATVRGYASVPMRVR